MAVVLEPKVELFRIVILLLLMTSAGNNIDYTEMWAGPPVALNVFLHE